MTFAQKTWNDFATGGTPLDSGGMNNLEARLTAGFSDMLTAFNVMDPTYGATGDGVTDDTTAVQGAITAAAAANGGFVFFPAGTYLVQPLLLPAGTVLRGVNGQAYYNATSTVPNVNTLSRLQLIAGSTGALISPNDAVGNKATAVRIFDLALDCNNITQPAINMPDVATSISRFWLVENVYVSNIGGGSGFAIYIGNQNTAVMLRGCIVFNGTSGSQGGWNGIGWFGSDGRMDNCFVGYCANNGFVYMGGANDETFLMTGGGIFTCLTGYVGGGSGDVLVGVSIDHNFNDGAFLGQGIHAIIGCTFHTNSRQTDNIWSNINLNGANAKLYLAGSRWGPRSPETTNNAAYMVKVTSSSARFDGNGNYLHAGVVMGTAWTNYGASFPTAGTWAVGDTVPNLTPIAGGNIGWVCVTAGTPGAWKAYGAIDA